MVDREKDRLSRRRVTPTSACVSSPCTVVALSAILLSVVLLAVFKEVEEVTRPPPPPPVHIASCVPVPGTTAVKAGLHLRWCIACRFLSCTDESCCYAAVYIYVATIHRYSYPYVVGLRVHPIIYCQLYITCSVSQAHKVQIPATLVYRSVPVLIYSRLCILNLL